MKKMFFVLVLMVMLDTHIHAQTKTNVIYEITNQPLSRLDPLLFTSGPYYYFDVLMRKVMVITPLNRTLKIHLNLYTGSEVNEFFIQLKKRKGKWFSDKPIDELKKSNLLHHINVIMGT